MNPGTPSQNFFSGKWRRPAAILLAIVIIGLIVWALYSHFHKNQPASPPANAGTDLSQSQLLNNQVKAAQDSLDKKNYDQAAQYYYGAASNEYDQNNYQQAKSTLEECIKNVPDKYVQWYVYYALAKVAQSLNDPNLEKTSLQTAIQKAQQPNSGEDKAGISSMQKQLKAIQ